MSNATTHPTQLGPAQAKCKHARVSRSICEFLHSRLTHAAERECTRTTDISKYIHSGGAAVHSGGVTKDARSGVSSANARDVTAERECIRPTHAGEDIYSHSATTDACSGDASADARNVTQESVHQQSATQSVRAPNLESASSADETKTSASSVVVINKEAYRYGATNGARRGDLRADACTVSHLTCDTKVLIPLLMQPRMETSIQPCQPEHALIMQPRTESSTQPCQLEHALSTQPRMESSSQPCQLEYVLSMQPRTESHSQPCQLEYALSIMPVSPLTRDAAVQTLPAPPLCEDSSQTREPERAPPTGGKPCAIIVPVSLSTLDNAIQNIKIETSAGSADVATQSASSADSTETPATDATAEKYLQEQIIHAYGNGPYNHKQKEEIFKKETIFRALHKQFCEERVAIERAEKECYSRRRAFIENAYYTSAT